MADEPVTAWREPFSRRARRWARRNRTAVTTAAAAVLVALAGTATVLAVQTRANRDLREANDADAPRARPGPAELRPGPPGRGRLPDPRRPESPAQGTGPARPAPGAAGGRAAATTATSSASEATTRA